ncbi:MAG: inorganic phosphate transporter [Roseibacillus sp.]
MRGISNLFGRSPFVLEHGHEVEREELGVELEDDHPGSESWSAWPPGYKVMETIGKKITELTPSRGFAANIVVASRMGFPISTTHTLIGAVLGIGLARGIDYLNLKVVRDIAISWMITIPAGGGLAMLFYLILKACFG